MLEALLQTGGVLARASGGADRASVLGKVNRAEFPSEAHAGDRILLDVDAVQEREDGTICEGTVQQDWGEKIKMCRTCEVFTPLLTPKAKGA